MFTPGAAIFTAGPKLLKNANVSSGTVALSPMSVRSGPAAPHTPSLSPCRAVITFGLLTGVVADAIFSVIPSGDNLGDACFDRHIYDIIERGRIRALDTNVKNVYPSDVRFVCLNSGGFFRGRSESGIPNNCLLSVFDYITIEVNKYLT